jgi:Ni/Fe-hydrogenase subunit HybB-like protein
MADKVNPIVFSEVAEVMEKAMNSIVASIESKSQWASRLALELFIPTLSAAGYEIVKTEDAVRARLLDVAASQSNRAANKEGV